MWIIDSWLYLPMPDAYVDETFRDEKNKKVGKVGYKINFDRFFTNMCRRELHDIDAELKQVPDPNRPLMP